MFTTRFVSPRGSAILGCMKRRDALKVLGATASAAALTACGSSVPSASQPSIPSNAVKIGAVSQVQTQFPVIGTFKRYRSDSSLPSEDLFVMRTPYMPRTASSQDEGLKVTDKIVLVARTLVCSGCNKPISNAPIQPQCACSYAEVQSAVCRQSGCSVYSQGLQTELKCQSCDSEFNPESGMVLGGRAEFALYSYRLEQFGGDLYILV